jgi:hypothetical protein
MNHHDGHLEDEAELYALGMLDEHESARVDAHARTCDACAERLGRAEATVAAMAEATVSPSTAAVPQVPLVPRLAIRRAPRFNLPAWSAAAAALALAVSTGVLADQNVALRHAVNSDGGAMLAMVRSHFSHAQFTSPAGGPMDAKVIYEPHGRWYEVLAVGADPSWRLAAVRDGKTIELPQRFSSRGDVAVLGPVAAAAPMRELQLRDGSGRLVGVVRPPLASSRTSGAVSLNR